MSGMSDTERLIAIQQIQELQARRCHAVDTKDWATYEALHAPDHVSDNEGDQKIVGSKANAERVAKALADKVSVHHLHTPIITFQSPTHASGIWIMEDHLWWKEDDIEHWLHGMGYYNETYEKRDGKWLFTSRRLRRHKVIMSPDNGFGLPKARED